MELKEALEKRRSVRDFLPRDVDIEIVTEIIGYANMAPSAGNLQSRDFIIVKDDHTKEELCEAALGQRFIMEAPICVVVCANLRRISPYGKRGRELYCIQDASASVDHILLASLDYNLGTCWVGAFHEERVSDILDLPYYARPVAIIPIGYPAVVPPAPPRMDIKKLIHLEKW
mgnify:CR=1 FL=1